MNATLAGIVAELRELSRSCPDLEISWTGNPDDLFSFFGGRYRLDVARLERLLFRAAEALGTDRWFLDKELAQYAIMAMEREVGTEAKHAKQDWYAGKIKDAAKVLANVIEDLYGKPEPANGTDGDAFVLVSTLWPERFEKYADCKKFLVEHRDEVRNKQDGQRRLVHAGDWVRYWAQKDRKGFESLDDREPEELTGVDVDAFLDGTKERHKELKQKKSQRKPKK